MRSALQERLKKTGAEQGKDLLQEAVDFCHENVVRQRNDRNQAFESKFIRFEKMAQSDFSSRLRINGSADTRDVPLTGSIFDRENFSLQLVRDVIKFILSRIYKDVFGSTPWFSVTPQGPHDAALASQVMKHSGWKLDQADWKGMGREAMQVALELGWVATKTAWRREEDVSESLRLALYDPATEQHLVTQAGEYVYDDDDTQPLGADIDPAMGGPGADPMGAQVPQDQALSPGLNSPMVFAKDPTIPVPDAVNQFTFKDTLVEEKTRLYSGLDASVIGWRDVTWEINAHSAELGKGCSFISHTVARSIEQLRSTFNADGKNEELEATLQSLYNRSNERAESDKPKEGLSEPSVNGICGDPENPTIRVVECYFIRRVLPTGPESRIFLCYAEETRKLIFTEYLSQISPRGQAPIHITAINRVPGRAYGIGLYEIFEMSATLMDRCVNGILHRNEYHANPIRIISKKAAEEMNLETIQIGPDRFVVVDTKSEPVADQFHTLAMQDMDERTWDLMELAQQLIQLGSGVTNAAQGNMSNLQSSDTATGVNSLLESSSVLHQFTLNEIRDGLERPLKYAIECNYFYQDQDETYAFMEGDTAAIDEQQQAKEQLGQVESGIPQETGVMSLGQARALADMPMNVQILLSRAKQMELRQASMDAMQTVINFYTLPPNVQLRTLPFLTQILRGIEIDNADKSLPTAEELQQQIAAMAQNPQTDGTPASERINIAYKDLAEPLKRQLEAKLGLDPLTPEQEAAEAARLNAKEEKNEPPAA